MNHSTHQTPAQRAADSFTTEPHFAPNPDTLVVLATAELPAGYLLLCHTKEHGGFNVNCLVFNTRLTTGERVEALRHTKALPVTLADQIAEEITRRGAQAVTR
jgi:hypothetical protein